MQREAELALLRRLRNCMAERTTDRVGETRRLRTDVYTSPERLADEERLLFARSPLVAALSSDLPEAGSYLTMQMGRVPVLIVRGSDNVCRAFVNACRHRGTRVACTQTGKASKFVCPFHAWSYDRTGQLVGVPEPELFGTVDRNQLGLKALPCEEKYGIIWVGLDADNTIDLDGFLGDLGPELASWQLGKESSSGYATINRRINWKLAVDTFGETYHFNVLHPDSVAMFFHANRSAYDTYGPHHRMSFIARTIGVLDQMNESDWTIRPHALLAYYLFPNTQLLIQPDGVSLFRIFPGDTPSDSVTHLSFYPRIEPTTEEEKIYFRTSFERTRDVIDYEDYAQAETMQRSFESGLIGEITFGRNEPALHHYHANYEKALCQAA